VGAFACGDHRTPSLARRIRRRIKYREKRGEAGLSLESAREKSGLFVENPSGFEKLKAISFLCLRIKCRV
jgi:hypothetical protein